MYFESICAFQLGIEQPWKVQYEVAFSLKCLQAALVLWAGGFAWGFPFHFCSLFFSKERYNGLLKTNLWTLYFFFKLDLFYEVLYKQAIAY